MAVPARFRGVSCLMDSIADFASLFKALSEPVRLRILYLLLERGELCVCDLVGTLGVSQSVVSRHLAYLRNNQLVRTRREGVWIYYQLVQTDEFTAVLLQQFHQRAAAVTEARQDVARLNQVEGAGCC